MWFLFGEVSSFLWVLGMGYVIIPPAYEVYRGYIVFAFSVRMLVIPPAYEVYRGYIVFAFSVRMLVCVFVC